MTQPTQYLELDGATIAYQRTGTGNRDTLVLSHSLFFNRRMFDGLVAELADEFDIVAYDHRGHGESSTAHDQRYDMDAHYNDAAALIEALASGPVHFAGNSMGGFVALRIATRRPDLVKTVTILGSSGEAQSDRPKFAQLLEQMKIDGGASIGDILSNIFFGQSSLARESFATTLAQWRSHLEALTPFAATLGAGVVHRTGINSELRHAMTPILAIAGAEDPVYPAPQSRAVAEAAPDGSFVLVEGAGHSVALEQPEAAAAAIRAFIVKRSAI